MQTLYFLVNSVLSFLVYAFLLRVLLQVVRADFRNPLAQAVVALTNWLVLPLRKVLPPVGRFDTASLVALVAVQVGAKLVLQRLVLQPMPYGFVVEALLPERVHDAPAVIRMDIHMLELLGARERTKAEYRELVAGAGFEVVRVVPTRAVAGLGAGLNVIEATPRG